MKLERLTTIIGLLILAGADASEAAVLTPEPTEAARVGVACTASIEYPWGEVYVEYNRFDPTVEHHYWDDQIDGHFADGSASMMGLDVEPCRVGDLYDLVLWPFRVTPGSEVYDGMVQCTYGSWNVSSYEDDRYPSQYVSVGFRGFGDGCHVWNDWARVRIEQRTSSEDTRGRQVKARGRR